MTRPQKLAVLVDATPRLYNFAGDLITYTYTIVNVGSVPLSGPFAVEHYHPGIGVINPCGNATALDVGEITSCSHVHTITSQDVDQAPLSTEAVAYAAGGAFGADSARIIVYR